MSTETLRHWQFVDFGLQHLRLAEAPLPQPGPGQILVRVEAASLNYRDLLVARNQYGIVPRLPFVPASDLAGVVLATGPGVTRWRGGERVLGSYVANWVDGLAPADVVQLGYPGPGALATHVLLDQHWAVAAPARLAPAQASTLPIAGLTAWFALFEEGRLKPGQTVLVHGTGGVAFLAGGAVNGGRIAGTWPGLAESQLNERRDLLATSDMRGVFKGVLESHLGIGAGASDGRIFPGSADAAAMHGLVRVS